jgi:hypothetical protein
MKTNNLIKSICIASMTVFAGNAIAQSNAQAEKKIKIVIVDDKNGVQTKIDTTIMIGGSTGADSIDVMIAAEIEALENETGGAGTGEKVIIKKICIIDSTGGSGTKVMHGTKGMSEADIEKMIEEMKLDSKDGKVQKVIVMDEKNLPEGTTITKEVKKNGNRTEVKMVIKTIDVKPLSAEDKKLLSGETTNIDNKLDIQKIDFFPNPNNGKFNLKFNLSQKGNTEVVVYNAEGKKAYYEMLKDFSGDYSKEIDISNNSKGVYFLKVTQGKNAGIRKIVLE